MKLNKKLAVLNLVLFSAASAQATLTPTIKRGDKNIYFNSPNGVQEVCVIPKHYPDIKYKKKNLKKEVELCSYNFYPSNDSAQPTVALCPKTNSTNPGVNIFEIDTAKGQSKQSLEASKCAGADKIGKYKNSTSCSYTPALLGYYHLSQILGGIGRVPPAVLRTMDKKTHIAIANKGIAQTPAAELINQTWRGLLSILNQGLAHPKKDLVLSDDGNQSYGAFIQNPKKEGIYKLLFNAGPDRAVAFRDKNPIFAAVRDRNSLDKIVSSQWNQANVQKLLAMRDVTEFIILDHILDQQDRFGNIAYQPRFAYFKKDEAADTDMDLTLENDADDFTKDSQAGLTDPSKPAVAINSMILKDNDCGVSKTNVVKAAGLLKYVAHMNPKTYKKLLKFQASVANNKSFFTSNLMFTQKDYDEMVINTNDAVNILKTNCKSGALKLDLDVEEYLSKGTVTPGSCELPAEKTTSGT
jgi:hypothetical protein